MEHPKHNHPAPPTGKLNINQWAEEDRPREKLMRLGAEALTNAELLAILIGSGSTRETAVELMKRLLGDCNNNLNTLGKMSISDLIKFKGIGEAKAITILAACELGKRRQREQVEERPQLSTATRMYNYLHTHMQDLDVEESWVLLLNQNYRLIKSLRLSHGGITETAVDVRLVLKQAILANATIIVLAHNHPSGSLRPSAEDDRLTQSMIKACDIMRIRFQDHLIITDGSYYSYHEEGKC
jgi:DNA repair protein RadC